MAKTLGDILAGRQEFLEFIARLAKSHARADLLAQRETTESIRKDSNKRRRERRSAKRMTPDGMD